MNPDNRWNTLQLHLKAAKAARDAGDRAGARESVEAALAIDPEFIAARMLRESLERGGSPPPRPAEPAARPDAIESSHPAAPLTERYASFEARARQRRIEQRVGFARAAIADRRFADAGDALVELGELEPDLPATRELTASLAAARDTARRRRLMLPVGAAAALVGVVLGLLASRYSDFTLELPWNGERESVAALDARPAPFVSDRIAIPVAAPPALDVAPAAALPEEPVDDVRPLPVSPPAAPPAPTPVTRQPRFPEAAPPRAVERAAPQPVPVAGAADARVPPPPIEPPPAAAVVPAPAAVPAPIPVADDATLIREALQRYRRAYNGLDARLAHAVYPGVDEAALARAFDGLHSQSLEFDSCTLDAQADSARAVCRGSARYVPKVGSRAPRAEPRIWTFRLNKNNGDWTISSAWTDR